MIQERLKAKVRGAVQGIGFRPFIYRLATELRLRGWVSNTSYGVLIEAEGPRPALHQFLRRMEAEKPALAIIRDIDVSFLDAMGYEEFAIRNSDDAGTKKAFILPDIALCSDCRSEIDSPGNRRYRYPFTNCTNCGPRFSIIESLPYDRPNTSMKRFAMCRECEEEYHNPANRRFHAQPNACPNCGPQLELWNAARTILAKNHDALLAAATAVSDGQILALKGVGGFQFIVDARNEDAVHHLRAGKNREEKPFAVMYPSLEMLREDCSVNEIEASLLTSPAAPIVIVGRNPTGTHVANAVAPQNPNLGAMLPSSPLHHLLMRELGFPIVATSGNRKDEPICIDETEALNRLRGIADLFLVHNRPVVRPVDDSVARVMCDRETILRRARGYAPLPIHVRGELPTIIAFGAHLKNTVALGIGEEIFVSQHIGDLETGEAWSNFCQTSSDLQRLYDFKPEVVACDLHPDYLSTKHAKKLSKPLAPVQHHYAHVLSCMAENELEGPVLGVAWDGTGLGPDDTIWGGEFLLIDDASEERLDENPFKRFAHLRNFRLPGGDAAVKQPRRSALGVLWEIFGVELFERREFEAVLQQFSETELNMIRRMLARGLNSPFTSSAGRLFDAAAAIIGLRSKATFEGQAAMELEFATERGVTRSYPFHFAASDRVVDWEPMMSGILEDIKAGETTGQIAAAFHNTLCKMIVDVAAATGIQKVALTGGCFQNKYLTESVVTKLRERGFEAYWHHQIPPNDGGIAVGQVTAAARVRQVRHGVIKECYA
jgi:hydrogenase maturation protein HypF